MKNNIFSSKSDGYSKFRKNKLIKLRHQLGIICIL